MCLGHYLAAEKWGARIQTLIFLTPKPWGHPHVTSTLHGSLFSRAGTYSTRQCKQGEKEGAQQSVGAWRVAVPVPLSCLIPRFCITLAFHMFTSHFALLMLTLAYPRRECWLEACFLLHHGGAKNVLCLWGLLSPEGRFCSEESRGCSAFSWVSGHGPHLRSCSNQLGQIPHGSQDLCSHSFVCMRCSSFFFSTDVNRTSTVSEHSLIIMVLFDISHLSGTALSRHHLM